MHIDGAEVRRVLDRLCALCRAYGVDAEERVPQLI